MQRPRPLTHLGFSYLPTPGMAFGSSRSDPQEGEPLWIESITIYPHGLTGELPFVSHRFVELVEADFGEEEGLLAEVALEAHRTVFPFGFRVVAQPFGLLLALLSQRGLGHRSRG